MEKEMIDVGAEKEVMMAEGSLQELLKYCE